ncbi:Phytanoyl-CoA dioxygenase [Serratia sp. AS12]|uniref:phytanoyl-CoA dioxygenase family protein n=1 Tax=Serratia TaxID=613 RepID=UPI00020E9ADA|nr:MULTISPECIES: phytanoyl-CoA dioxygenase family protein [Serratia]AEF45415.1 Phytanoyl-CoA dioxygenase [Serratia plymuthica AS9]AEF50366.1 Phytanoyl-CoA dioxygenase [Serratia sp. AS12]AEG28073.1 Phytanoyl-CoA dioxygenase [Serratia sp. AS13]UTN98883.1 phytanoyl-CoA dioxygenase family protein [Serratia plymuthica]
MTDTLFLQPDALSANAFSLLCEQSLTLSDYPLAAEAEKNVLIYHNAALLEPVQSDKIAVLSELHRALSTGPGVLVIKGAYPDSEVIERHNRVFDAIFQQEAARGNAGDHFSAAGNNGRIWNSLQKTAEQDAGSFIEYYSNPTLALVSEAWLGPWYQMTAQVNVVRPGGKAQQPHRDYHLGFQENRDVQRFPLPLQLLSQYLTLQGAVAHSAMPLESGPTQLLPFSQQYPGGYLAWRQPEFIDYFRQHAVQLPLAQGDALFFNPALFHAAGNNVTHDHVRIANLLQVSSAFGKPMETVNRLRLLQLIYPALRQRYQNEQLHGAELAALVAAAADGYSFPTNLDSDPPLAGLAPQTQQQLLLHALQEDWNAEYFNQQLERQQRLRSA